MLRREGSSCLLGTYWGFVGFLHQHGNQSGRSQSLHYHHGFGGGGEITRGLIDHSRTRGMYAADIYVSGHIHRRNYDENIVTAISPRGVVHQRTQLFLRCASYKAEHDGWHAEKGRAARPIGGWWLVFNSIKNKKEWSIIPSASATT